METIRIENLSVAYRGKIALEHVNLELSAGKLTGIVGPNGAGKSTLMKGVLQLIKIEFIMALSHLINSGKKLPM